MPQHDKARPEPFKPGDRLSASWVQKVENFISSFRVLSGGQFVFDGRNAVLQCFSGGFSGVVYLGGKKFEGLKEYPEKPYIKIDLIGNTVTEEQGPPSDPFPPGEEWYEKSKTPGDIHIPRFG